MLLNNSMRHPFLNMLCCVTEGAPLWYSSPCVTSSCYSLVFIQFSIYILCCDAFFRQILFCSIPPVSNFCHFPFNAHPSFVHPLSPLTPKPQNLLQVPVNGHVDLKTNLTPPLITHTAATPMPIPKLPVGGDPALGYESRRGSSVSVDPACYDKSPVCIFILAYTNSLCQLSSAITLFQDFRKSTLIHV